MTRTMSGMWAVNALKTVWIFKKVLYSFFLSTSRATCRALPHVLVALGVFKRAICCVFSTGMQKGTSSSFHHLHKGTIEGTGPCFIDHEGHRG